MKSGKGAPVLTVDGPGGSGKGTICREVAARMGWDLLDSGALYRAVAVRASQAGFALPRRCKPAHPLRAR